MSRGPRAMYGTGARWIASASQHALACLLAGALAATTGAAEQAADETGEQPTPTPIQRYLDSVRDLEAEDGAWSPALQQELFGLGLTYQQHGRHAEAVVSLSRAEHITRINEGLYSSADLPILERLIESHAALGEWDKVHNRYRQVFLIHQRNYGEHDERLLPVLERLSAWHMRSYLDASGGDPVEHLLNARRFYDSAVTIIETKSGPRDPRIADALRRRALVDYYVASHAPLVREGFGFGDEPIDEMAIQAHIANSFVAGRDALRRAAELRHDTTVDGELACSEALAELADWHQLFARRQSALRLYQEAWAHGERSGDQAPAILATVFGAPRPLPQIPDEFDANPAPRTDTAWIRVQFDVGDNGRASDVQVIESSPPASGREVARLRKRVLATPFRPRFEGGQPVATPDVDYRYSYTP